MKCELLSEKKKKTPNFLSTTVVQKFFFKVTRERGREKKDLFKGWREERVCVALYDCAGTPQECNQALYCPSPGTRAYPNVIFSKKRF